MINIVKKLIGEDKKLVEKGDYYFGMGNYKSALYHYKKALEINEKNEGAKKGINKIHAEMAFKKGIRLTMENNYNRAIALFNEAIRLNKELEPKATEKINLCKKILELRKKADELYEEGDYKDAIVEYKNVLKVFPQDRYSIDKIYKINKLKKIMENIDELLNKIEISYDESIGNEILEKLNKLESIDRNNLKIRKYIETVTSKLVNLEINSKINEGKKLYEDGHYENALAKFNAVIKLDNNNEEAIEYKTKIEKILALRQDSEELYRRGEYNHSLSKLNEILDINPNDEYAKHTIQVVQDMIDLMEEGNKYYINNDFEDAIAIYNEILKLNPKDEHIKNISDQIIKNYLDIIKSITPENYREVYTYKCNPIIEFSPIIFDEYINNLKNLIDDLYEQGNYEKSIEILFYYWELIGGKGIIDGFELESSVKSVKVIKQDKNVAVVGCEYIPKLRYAPMYCIDIQNRQILWKYNVACDSYILKVKDEDIIVGCNLGHVTSVNLNDGSTQWKILTDNNAPVADILIMDKKDGNYDSHMGDVVFAGCKFGYIYALNRDDGKVLWTHKSPHDIIHMKYIKNVLCAASGNPTILSGGGAVYGIDIKTGYILWKYAGNYIYAMEHCMKYNSIIIGTSNEMIYSINGNNGDLLWKYATHNRVIKTISLDKEEDILIAGSGELSNVSKLGSNIYALDLKTGLEKWIHRAKSEGIESTDIVNTKNGKIVMAKGIYKPSLNITPVYIMELNSGKLLWKYRAKGHIRAVNAVNSKNPTGNKHDEIDNFVYDGIRIKYIPHNRPNSITVQNLEILEGHNLSSYNISNDISELLVSDETNNILVGCFDGRVYIFNKNEVENGQFILLQEILKTSPIISELLHDEIKHILDLINQKKPFSNPVKAKRLIDKAKKLLNRNDYYKARELINESRKYTNSNIELDAKLMKKVFEINTWEDVGISFDYIKGDMPLYNLRVTCSDESVKLKYLKFIDKISPGESKMLRLLMLPVYKGKYPLALDVICEDEEGNPLEKKVFEYWITVKSIKSDTDSGSI
ncbi:outer membrane protein assembly factor BamB family protein [Methanococcus aeolicus]|uniref:outer membrane protein assembly factor BamB family protein n=1 Tax=Methanococcus aeolicus TaxID=42879 RepID=UPI0021C84E24|nr:PQQ-binding-like beta-propeller repeat protein [Methanococcus aeolicus]UXM84096.1 tetratricopeptide repeat protein [Methanococcus aeolicus]